MGQRQSEKNKIRAKKRFGQNFLIDPDVLDKLLESIGPEAGDQILEIGVGKGVVTEKMLAKKSFVTGIELDNDLISFLNNKFDQYENFTLIHTDILDYIPDFDTPFKLIGNIPYNITTKIFEKILHWPEKPERMVFMIQREVGEKILRKGGKNNPLSLCVDLLGEPEILMTVPPHAFDPAPKVHSVILHIDCSERAEVSDPQPFYQFTQRVFRMPRKTLLNNLIAFIPREQVQYILSSLQLDPTLRPEKLSFEELYQLFLKFSKDN